MGKMNSNKIDLNISGMTCASCSTRIEKKLSKLEDISEVNVNLSTSKATIKSEEKIDFDEITSTIEKLGFEVEKEKIEIDIEGMTCSACSSRIEKQIAKMDGIIQSNVNLSTNKGTFLVLKGYIMKKHL